jgi:hypothetical protein
MSQFVKRMLAMATVAALALTAAGCTDAGAAAAASRATGPAVYSDQQAGYQAAGRWFRYVATTVTVPPRTLSYLNSGSAFIGLNGRYAAWINVDPGGGADSVGYAATNVGTGPFRLAPRVGDRLAISIYYDQRGYIFFTVTDLTRPATQTVMLYVSRLIYSAARLWVQIDRVLSVVPPAVGARLWQFTGSRLTTYSGDHGTIAGPWTTSKMITTTTGTASGTVIVSPSGLSSGGRDFTAWFRAMPLTYTSAFAGYADSGGPFRFVSTTLTVPLQRVPGEAALVSLGYNGGATPRPYTSIEVLAGGGAGSISYQASTGSGSFTSGTFTIRPKTGDQLTVSIYYDQHGHEYFTVTDATRHTTQTVKVTGHLQHQRVQLSRDTRQDQQRRGDPAADRHPAVEVHRQPRHHLPRQARHHPRPLGHQPVHRYHHKNRCRGDRDERLSPLRHRPELRRLAAP